MEGSAEHSSIRHGLDECLAMCGEEEFERRRRAHASPAQKVVEEFMLETMDSTTEHLPARSHETQLSLREIMLRIDEAIGSGNAAWHLAVAQAPLASDAFS